MAESQENRLIELGSLIPREINGWTVPFVALLARKYTREDGPAIIADIFDMESSRNAFGVFTHDLEGEETGIGQDSTYKGGLLTFWKGCFFVSIYAEEETEEAKKTLLDLGIRVSAAIKEEGERPQILSLLPQENLVQKRVRFFFNHLILNYHFFVADENILHIDTSTDAALGVYRDDDGTLTVILVRYADNGRAAQAYRSFVDGYMPDASERGLIQTEDGKWTGIEREGDTIILVFGAPGRGNVTEMILSVLHQIRSKK